MPPEATNAKIRRRASKRDLDDLRFDGGHARELELKRTRGEVSCAECRRLKIKCDKQVPCKSCIRRGCVALCPNGSLATGQGTRFVLAATEHLHKRIEKYGTRVRELEDALAALQSEHSSEQHPLLHEASKMALDEGEGIPDAPEQPEASGSGSQSSEVVDVFGTLSISEGGLSRFFGPTGGSESLLMARQTAVSAASPQISHSPDSTRGSNSPMSVGELSLFSRSFPFTPLDQPGNIQEFIESTHLPPYEKALAYCERYFSELSWLFRGVTRAQIIDDTLPVVYKRQPNPPGEEYDSAHDLSLLFSIFSIASLLGPEKSSAHSEHFWQIARVCLSIRPVLEQPSTSTIQTLHLLSIYNAMGLGGEGVTMETTWSLVTLASHLAHTLGLHRDAARWGLSPKLVRRRRILFWDLFVADVWQSLNTGRPPAIALRYVDCQLPEYDDIDTNPETAFELWQFRFAAEIVADVGERTLTAEAPSYATIMELDRKIREFPTPDVLQHKSDMAEESQMASFQRCVLEHVRETILLYIHRSFFAQAMMDHPENPLKSTYAPSFLASYRASSTILKSVKEQFAAWPQSSVALWMMWTFAFSGAVVFGTVVTRGPKSPLAASAMQELEKACILFSNAAAHSPRAAIALPILKKLGEKARLAFSAAKAESEDSASSTTTRAEDSEDELAIFSGHARVLNTGKVSGSAGGSRPTSSHSLRSGLSSCPQPQPRRTSATTETWGIRQPQPVHRCDPGAVGTSSSSAPSEAAAFAATAWPSSSSSSSHTQTHSEQPSDVTPSTSSAIMNVNVLPPGHPPVYGYGYDPSMPSMDHLVEELAADGYEWGKYVAGASEDAGLCLRQRWWYGRQEREQGRQEAERLRLHEERRLEAEERERRQRYERVPPIASSSNMGAGHGYHHHHTASSRSGYPAHAQPHPLELPRLSQAHMQGDPHSHSHGNVHGHYSSSYPTTPTYYGHQPLSATTPLSATASAHSHPMHHPHQQQPVNALADLGFAARDSRLDQKWSMYMSDSGILDGIGGGHGVRR